MAAGRDDFVHWMLLRYVRFNRHTANLARSCVCICFSYSVLFERDIFSFRPLFMVANLVYNRTMLSSIKTLLHGVSMLSGCVPSLYGVFITLATGQTWIYLSPSCAGYKRKIRRLSTNGKQVFYMKVG